MKRLVSLFVFIAIILNSIYMPINVASKGFYNENIQNIEGTGAVLMDALEGNILYQKNPHMHLYPASTTKILTALIAIENGDLNEIVTVGDEIDLVNEDGSKANLIKGERISLINLLRGLLIPSGNDAACTIAVHMAGKISENPNMNIADAMSYFSKVMNQRAKRLGALDSNFINPHGYHDLNHYSTPFDMALIAREAIKKEIFREIVNTSHYEMPILMEMDDISKDKTYHKWINTNELIRKNSKYYYKFASGIKTGYTAPAGNCLVSFAEKDGLQLICVILKSSYTGRWSDSKILLNYGIENFEKYYIKRANESVCVLEAGNPLIRGKGVFNAISDRDVFKVIKKEDVPRIKMHMEFDKRLIKINEKSSAIRLKKSLSKGQIIGKVTFSLDGYTIGNANLLSERDVKKNWETVFIGDAEILTLIIMLIILIIILARGKFRTNFRKHKKRYMI